ncbi:hypothetical protein G6F37_008259 [Rhizopus arrhizus]|nr:hypothetical protein G6F37_008259 [Rhizopus arrhizus]
MNTNESMLLNTYDPLDTMTPTEFYPSLLHQEPVNHAESGKKVKRQKRKKKKSGQQVEDPNAPPKPKRNTGLSKPLILSASLSVIMGGDKELSRPEIVKRLWTYIKTNQLQDPADRRFILCDNNLRSIFQKDRVNSFGMNRDLTAHLTKKVEKKETFSDFSFIIEDFSF